MIVAANHIRKVRAVSASIPDGNIEPYIQEAENLHVRTTLTPELYKRIEDTVITDNLEVPTASNDDDQITTGAEFDTLLLGGYYDNDTKYFAGLIAAVAYLAHSRMVMEHGVTATSFGVTMPSAGEFGQPVDYKTRKHSSNKSEKIGLEYLAGCVEYLKFTEVIPSDSTTRRRKRFRAIGN
jgi:hypothetical protein